MQAYSQQHSAVASVNDVNNQYCAIPTQNRYAPLHEWVGYSMDTDMPGGQEQNMDIDSARGKRRRFNTGAGQSDFSHLSLDAKLAHICHKLDNLELSNSDVITNITQGLSTVNARVEHVENQTLSHELVLKVLAYKSIDIKARSRRFNLLFHGLAENRSENCSELLHDFMWHEMGIDSDDLYIGRVHRLGSLHMAKMKNEVPRRPIVVSFNDDQSVQKVLSAAYMLKGTNYSVSKDFPKEIVSARQRLIPRYKAERENRNKVSIEYPAKLVVKGKVVADEFPDWYSVLKHDRHKLVNAFTCHSQAEKRQYVSQSGTGGTSQHVSSLRDQGIMQNCNIGGPRNINSGYSAATNSTGARIYAKVVSLVAQQSQPLPTQQTFPQPVSATPVITSNIPRYSSVQSENQHFTPATTENTTIHSGDDVQRPTHSVSNGTVTRDQPTYTNL